MQFLMRLAHRLSRIKRGTLVAVAVVSAAAAVLSCELPVSSKSSGTTVGQLILSPKVVTLQQNQLQGFVAVGLTPAGDTAQITVAWSATGGTLLGASNSGGRHYEQYQGTACGAFTVTATSRPGAKSDAASVTVNCAPAPVASVSVSPPTATVQAGLTVQLTATPLDAGGNPLSGRVVTWSSNNTAAATVNGSGLVTGVAPGSAMITATSEGKSGASTITVTNVPVASVDVTPSPATVQAGQTVQLTATPLDAGGNPLSGRVVTWSSNNTAAATVNSSGLVTGVAPGSATITATSEGKSGTSAVTVTGVPVASVTVTPASASVQAGSTVQLTATPKDAAGNPLPGRVVTWASGNAGVATVNGSGLVTGVAAGGPVTITATSEGQSGTSSITVSAVPVASVTVSPATASVQAGSSVQLTATPRDAAGNPLPGRVVTWASGNTGVATVNGSGLVTGVAAGGPVTITATSEGQSGTAAITVTTPTPPGTSMVLVGAGDIADCDASPTAALLDTIPGTVFTAGDNAYPDGSDAAYAQCYDPSWGRHKARTRPSPGNHDHNTAGAAGYFRYFGAQAGPAGLGYYSYELGAWHIISLDSEYDYGVGIDPSSPQGQWLRADLAATTKRCIIAYWHYPRFSSGSNHGSDAALQTFWDALYAAGATIVISGHDHEYERFAPQAPDGTADPVRGIREFVVGTGGAGLYSFGTPLPNSEVRDATSHGVLKLTLSVGSYTWQYVPVAGDSFTDSGSGTCH